MVSNEKVVVHLIIGETLLKHNLQVVVDSDILDL
jgi:hypothetical protein